MKLLLISLALALTCAVGTSEVSGLPESESSSKAPEKSAELEVNEVNENGEDEGQGEKHLDFKASPEDEVVEKNSNLAERAETAATAGGAGAAVLGKKLKSLRGGFPHGPGGWRHPGGPHGPHGSHGPHGPPGPHGGPAWHPWGPPPFMGGGSGSSSWSGSGSSGGSSSGSGSSSWSGSGSSGGWRPPFPPPPGPHGPHGGWHPGPGPHGPHGPGGHPGPHGWHP